MLNSAFNKRFLLTLPLLLAAFVMSVFFSGTDSILYAPAYTGLVLCGFVLLWPRLRSGVWDFPRSVAFLLPVLFGIYAAASVLWSQIPYVSVIFAHILCVLPFLSAALILTPEKDAVRFHAAAVFAAIGIFALWAVIQFFFLLDEYGPRIRHPMLNPNDLAALLCLGLVPTAGFFLAATKRRHIVWWLIATAVFFTALLATQSRGALLAAGISTISVVFLVGRGAPHALYKISALALLAAGIPLLLTLGGDGLLEKNLGNLPQIAESKSVTDRLMLWSSTVKMAIDHFWTGTGLGTFYFFYPAYRSPQDFSDGYFAHMDPLQFWSDMGIAAPLIFYAALIAILTRTVCALKKAGDDIRQRVSIAAPFCALLAVLLNAHISFHLYMPGLLIPMACYLAFWFVTTDGAENKTMNLSLARWPRRALTTTLVIVALASTLWMARWAAAVHYLNKAQSLSLQPEQNLAQMELQIKEAGRIAPASYGKYHEYEARLAVSKLWGKAKSMPENEVRDLFAQASQWLDEAEKRNPAYTATWDLRARLYYSVDGIVLDDGAERAQTLLEKVTKTNPLSTDSRIGLANILKAKGDTAGALRVLEDGITWPRPRGQRDVNYLLAVAQMRLNTGDRTGHDALAQEALARARAYGLIQKRE